MENNYNYYNSDGNYQYGGGTGGPQPDGQPPKKEKKNHKGIPKAVAVTGFAILFGVVSSAVFLTSNIIGTRIQHFGIFRQCQQRNDAFPVVQCGDIGCVRYRGECDAVNRIYHEYVGGGSSELLRRNL